MEQKVQMYTISIRFYLKEREDIPSVDEDKKKLAIKKFESTCPHPVYGVHRPLRYPFKIVKIRSR